MADVWIDLEMNIFHSSQPLTFPSSNPLSSPFIVAPFFQPRRLGLHKAKDHNGQLNSNPWQPETDKANYFIFHLQIENKRL